MHKGKTNMYSYNSLLIPRTFQLVALFTSYPPKIHGVVSRIIHQAIYAIFKSCIQTNIYFFHYFISSTIALFESFPPLHSLNPRKSGATLTSPIPMTMYLAGGHAIFWGFLEFKISLSLKGSDEYRKDSSDSKLHGGSLQCSGLYHAECTDT